MYRVAVIDDQGNVPYDGNNLQKARKVLRSLNTGNMPCAVDRYNRFGSRNESFLVQVNQNGELEVDVERCVSDGRGGYTRDAPLIIPLNSHKVYGQIQGKVLKKHGDTDQEKVNDAISRMLLDILTSE